MADLNVPLATFAGLLKNSLVEKRLQKFCQCCKNFMRIWFYAKLCRVCRHMNMKAITIRIRVCIIIRGLPGIISLIFSTKKVFQRGLRPPKDKTKNCFMFLKNIIEILFLPLENVVKYFVT